VGVTPMMRKNNGHGRAQSRPPKSAMREKVEKGMKSKTNKECRKANNAGSVAIINWLPVMAESRTRQYEYGQKFEVTLADGRRGLLRQGCFNIAGGHNLEVGGERYTLGRFSVPQDLRARLEGNIVRFAIRSALNTLGAILTLDFLFRLTSALEKSLASPKAGEAGSVGQALEASEDALRKFDCFMAAHDGCGLAQANTMLMDFAAALRGLGKRVSVLGRKPAGFRGRLTDRNVCKGDQVCDSLEDLLALKLDQAESARRRLADAMRDMEQLSGVDGNSDSGHAAGKSIRKAVRRRSGASR